MKRNAPLDVYTDFTHFVNFQGNCSNAQIVVYTIISRKNHSATKTNHIILNLSDLKVLPTTNDAQLK